MLSDKEELAGGDLKYLLGSFLIFYKSTNFVCRIERDWEIEKQKSMDRVDRNKTKQEKIKNKG